MDSYIELYDGSVMLGANSISSLQSSVHKKIFALFSYCDGGVSISFEPLTDDVFADKSACFDNPVPYGDEAYIVDISDDITIYYTAEISKIYALYAIKRNYKKNGICKGIIYNTPKTEFRGVRMFLPPKRKLDEFKKFIDMMLSFGNNVVMLEIGGAMEYKRHPEINQGWVEYCKIFEEFNGKAKYIQRITSYPKNSVHIDNGGGEYLTYEELAEIVDYCRERHIEIVPEVPTMCHVDYLLYNHPDLSELEDDILPNNACVSNEDYYKLIFDVLDEVVEVFRPKRINISQDESYVYGHCPRCKGKSGAELFGGHMVRLHDYLAQKGVRTMVWADGIIPTWHGGNAAYHKRMPWDGKRTVNYKGTEYKVRDFKCHSPEEWVEELKIYPDSEYWYCEETHQCIDFLPKDIECINWMWSCDPKSDGNLLKHNLFTVYGNFNAIAKKDFDDAVRGGIRGTLHSSWGRSDFEALQRTGAIFGMAFNSFANWNHHYDEAKCEDNVFAVANEIYNYMNYSTLHSRYLEIIHTTDTFIEHDHFVDGFVVNHEDYKIGEYEITYNDGSKETIGIYWGYNIYNSGVSYAAPAKGVTLAVEVGGYNPKYQWEPMGVTCPLYSDGRTYYKISVPVAKGVNRVEVKPCGGHNIYMKEYKLK